MNYQKALDNLGITNITVSTHSPRESGEREANSNWKEFKAMPSSFKNRLNLLHTLSEEYEKVWIKTATGMGRARIFYYVS